MRSAQSLQEGNTLRTQSRDVLAVLAPTLAEPNTRTKPIDGNVYPTCVAPVPLGTPYIRSHAVAASRALTRTVLIACPRSRQSRLRQDVLEIADRSALSVLLPVTPLSDCSRKFVHRLLPVTPIVTAAVDTYYLLPVAQQLQQGLHDRNGYFPAMVSSPIWPVRHHPYTATGVTMQ